MVDGIVITDVDPNGDTAYGMVVQPDGKIVVAGQSGSGSGVDIMLLRYDINGVLDTSFGGGDGIVAYDIAGVYNAGRAITLQTDGKILVTGVSDDGPAYDIALVRFNSDGTADTSFGGGDGSVTTAIGATYEDGSSVLVQADGQILVTGYSKNATDNDFALVRYNSDGTLDTNFDSNILNGNPTFTQGGPAVVLDTDVQLFDAELSPADNFSGATLNTGS